MDRKFDIGDVMGFPKRGFANPRKFRTVFGRTKDIRLDHGGALVGHLVPVEVNALIPIPRRNDRDKL